MNILKGIVCLFKGHDLDMSENLVEDIMMDPRNWLCPCKRCGRYVMHDGAISGLSVTLSKGAALRERDGLEREMEVIRKFSRIREEKDT